MKKTATLEKSKATKTVSTSAKVATAASVSTEKEAMKKEQAVEEKQTVAKVVVKKDVTVPKMATEKESTKLPEENKVENKKKEGKVEVFVQFYNRETVMDTVLKRVKEAYIADGNKLSESDDIRVYIKPEHNRAYYVINDSYEASITLYE